MVKQIRRLLLTVSLIVVLAIAPVLSAKAAAITNPHAVTPSSTVLSGDDAKAPVLIAKGGGGGGGG
ncbi:MAG TPA: hypothetical protein VNF03_10525, partial [Patescibacteria group bacterium]|nr:hypothetical protein [Patescibacteria group bacterium]